MIKSKFGAKIANIIKSIAKSSFFKNPSRAYKIGRVGEKTAVSFLKKRGYKVLLRNWKWKNYEIDAICLQNKALVFVEIKTRKESALQSGFYTVDKKKKANLKIACKAYLNQLKNRPKEFRLDVVEVEMHEDGTKQCKLFENIPLFNEHFC